MSGLREMIEDKLEDIKYAWEDYKESKKYIKLRYKFGLAERHNLLDTIYAADPEARKLLEEMEKYRKVMPVIQEHPDFQKYKVKYFNPADWHYMYYNRKNGDKRPAFDTDVEFREKEIIIVPDLHLNDQVVSLVLAAYQAQLLFTYDEIQHKKIARERRKNNPPPSNEVHAYRDSNVKYVFFRPNERLQKEMYACNRTMNNTLNKITDKFKKESGLVHPHKNPRSHQINQMEEPVLSSSDSYMIRQIAHSMAGGRKSTDGFDVKPKWVKDREMQKRISYFLNYGRERGF